MPMIAQVKHLLGGTTSCSIMAGQTTNVVVASSVTGDDLSSEIASMTRTARPDRTTLYLWLD